ncbi:MAG: hypothetical protein AAF772_05695 [Acidobacteriota bacterium]
MHPSSSSSSSHSVSRAIPRPDASLLGAPHAPLRRLLDALRPQLAMLIGGAYDDGEDGPLHEALQSLHDQDDERGQASARTGTLHLRTLLFWRRRQRRVVETIDRTILAQLSPGGLDLDGRRALRQILAVLIDQTRPRCRNLLRLRYGLEARTDELVARLAARRASLPRTLRPCMTDFARLLLARCLDADDG